MVTELIKSSHSIGLPVQALLQCCCSNSSLQLHIQITIRASNFIECLRSCFDNPNNVLMEFMLEAKQRKVYLPLFHHFKLFIIYFFFVGVQIQLGYGTSRYQFSLRGSFVSNQRKFKFYVLSNYKIEAMNVKC